jgi:hypothetical protein
MIDELLQIYSVDRLSSIPFEVYLRIISEKVLRYPEGYVVKQSSLYFFAECGSDLRIDLVLGVPIILPFQYSIL